MGPTFRASLSWLHTWAGLLLGSVLFAIFWMGSLAVFDEEIDRWMAPMTRLPATSAPVLFDTLRSSLDDAAAAQSPFWHVALPTERQPTLRVRYLDGGNIQIRHVDPARNVDLPAPGTLAGTGFLFPFHYSLHVRVADLGVWLVGLAGMAMLVLCVSGVVIHRKIFVELFTFRADGKQLRSVLDLHHVSGVLGLPFHLAITLSGLVISYLVYFPAILQLAYEGDHAAFVGHAYSHYERPKHGKPGETASLDAMVEKTRRLWDGDAPGSLTVLHPGDANSYVQIVRPNQDGVTAWADVAYFDTATGGLLHQRMGERPVMKAWLLVAGVHLVQFRHWTLRWVYFGLGLSGCVVIATGSIYWLESRRKRHIQLGLRGVPIVEGLTVASVSGIVIATLSFFVVNRLLPLGTTFLNQERPALEIWTFYFVWLLAFGHAWLRPRRAWLEQCCAIAALAIAAALLNWITTDDHLIRSVTMNHLWPIAGMDLLLLAVAAVAALTARKIQHRDAADQGHGVPARVAGSRTALEP